MLHFLVLNSFCDLHQLSETGDFNFDKWIKYRCTSFERFCNSRQCGLSKHLEFLQTMAKYSTSLLYWKDLRKKQRPSKSHKQS